jgi:hypothetical protein
MLGIGAFCLSPLGFWLRRHIQLAAREEPVTSLIDKISSDSREAVAGWGGKGVLEDAAVVRELLEELTE